MVKSQTMALYLTLTRTSSSIISRRETVIKAEKGTQSAALGLDMGLAEKQHSISSKDNESGKSDTGNYTGRLGKGVFSRLVWLL